MVPFSRMYRVGVRDIPASGSLISQEITLPRNSFFAILVEIITFRTQIQLDYLTVTVLMLEQQETVPVMRTTAKTPDNCSCTPK